MFKKGDKVVCVSPSEVLAIGKVYLVDYIDGVNGYVFLADACCGGVGWFPGYFKLYEEPSAEKPAQPFSYNNTKINVQKYADTYGISLQQAHKEIQPALFAAGQQWSGGSIGEVNYLYGPHLFCNSFGDGLLTHGDSESHFINHRFPEVVFQRTVTTPILTPSLVEPAKEIIELNGKKYYKEDLEKALASIVEIEA